MTELSYRPGAWFLACGSTGFVFAKQRDLVLRLWPLVSRNAGLAALMDETLKFGLAPLSDLLIAELEPTGLRVVVRGAVSATVVQSDQTESPVEASSVATWSEQLFSGARAVRASMLKMSGATDDAEFALQSGVVGAAAVSWVLDAGSGAAADSLPGAAPTGLPIVVPVQFSRKQSAAAGRSAGRRLEETLRGQDGEDTSNDSWDSVSLPNGGPAVIRDSQPRGRHARPVESPAESQLGDHDGSTIMAAQLRELRAKNGNPNGAARGRGAAGALLAFSTGPRQPLDRPVIVGRRPQADKFTGSEVPTLVTVPSPNGDISRSHVEIRADEEQIVATDLDSTNGTAVYAVDGTVTAVDPGGSVVLHIGDRVDLGDGVTIEVCAAR